MDALLDANLLKELMEVGERYKDLATWEMKSLTVGTVGVMLEVMSMVAEGGQFPWNKCSGSCVNGKKPRKHTIERAFRGADAAETLEFFMRPWNDSEMGDNNTSQSQGSHVSETNDDILDRALRRGGSLLNNPAMGDNTTSQSQGSHVSEINDAILNRPQRHGGSPWNDPAMGDNNTSQSQGSYVSETNDDILDRALRRGGSSLVQAREFNRKLEEDGRRAIWKPPAAAEPPPEQQPDNGDIGRGSSLTPRSAKVRFQEPEKSDVSRRPSSLRRKRASDSDEAPTHEVITAQSLIQQVPNFYFSYIP
jgi:K+-transporting ATPase c subunit